VSIPTARRTNTGIRYTVLRYRRLGIAIPDLVFQSRDSGLALPGSRDPGSANPFVNIGTLPSLLTK